MKKVVYSITKIGRDENTKITGLGYLNDEDLVIACVGKNQKPYIRIFEDCVKCCHPVINAENEFKGSYYEIKEVEILVKGSYEKREVELDYKIWYKILD